MILAAQIKFGQLEYEEISPLADATAATFGVNAWNFNAESGCTKPIQAEHLFLFLKKH